MKRLWELAPDDLPRLERCVAGLRAALSAVEPVVRVPRPAQDAGADAGVAPDAAAGRPRRCWPSARWPATTLWHSSARSPSSEPATAPRRRSRGGGPSCSSGIRRCRLFWPALARQARQKKAEWQVKAADVQVANGTAAADLPARLGQLKDQAPQLAPAIRKVEAAQEQVRHDERWKAVQAEALLAGRHRRPRDRRWPTIDAFLREFPDTPRRAEALALAQSLKDELATRRSAVDRQFVDDLVRSESLPNVSLADQIERARQFLADHPDSPSRAEVQRRLEMYLQRLDEQRHRAGPRLLAAVSRPSSRPGSSATRTT